MKRTHFFDSGQVDANSTLFTYDSGEDHQAFFNNSFEPMFVDELTFNNVSLEEEAKAACGGDINCLFDAASTKDVSLGESTKEVSIKIVEESNTISKDFVTMILFLSAYRQKNLRDVISLVLLL